MSIKTLSTGMLVAALGLTSTLALAQDNDRYIKWAGGVGADNRITAPDTGTKLVFFSENGQYIADVHYVIQDAEGKVLVDALSPGPWVVLDLPPGTYSVIGDFEGMQQGGEIVVDDDTEEFAYMFKDS